MENKQSQGSSKNFKNYDTNEFPTISVEKTYDVDREGLWKILTTPEGIKQWWGPKNYNCPHATIDLRKGGKYLWAMQEGQSEPMWTTGTVLELVPRERLVVTDYFSNESGDELTAEQAGLEDWPSAEEIIISYELSDSGDGKTILKVQQEGIGKKLHQDCTAGWDESLNKIHSLVNKN